MDAIIPLLNHSHNNYFELRFAIRSLCKHNDLQRILLVGGLPIWWKGEHTAHTDYGFSRKELNIRDKVIAGAKVVDGEFLFANDDHFTLAPYPGVHNKGLLSHCLAGRQPNGSYTRLLQNTYDFFGDVPNCDAHCPMMMNSEGVKRTAFDWPIFGYGFKTTYAAMNGGESVFEPDHKVMEVTGRELGPYFSTYENSAGLENLLKMFPEKSIFEK